MSCDFRRILTKVEVGREISAGSESGALGICRNPGKYCLILGAKA
jgi:hypothetical protein